MRNSKLGMAWLEYAAQNGSHYAAYRAGKEYLRGEVTDKNTEKAMAYMHSSAERGNQYAQYMLGKLYLMGREAEQDRDAAWYWLTQSAAQGNQYAQFFIDRFNDFRPPSVLLSATRLLHHMGNIFRDNSLPKTGAAGIRLDKKRMRKLMEKRQAQGVKGVPEMEEHQYDPTMSM